jgi:hypothetical protein
MIDIQQQQQPKQQQQKRNNNINHFPFSTILG